MDGIVKERGIILEDAKAYRTRIGGLYDAKERALQSMADHGEHNGEEAAHTQRKMERYQFERAALNWKGGHGTMELDDDGPKEDQRAQKKMPKWTLEADFADNSFVNQEDVNDPWTSNKTADSTLASAARGSADPVTTPGELVQRRRDRNWNTVQVVCITMPSNTDNCYMESILANPKLCVDV